MHANQHRNMKHGVAFACGSREITRENGFHDNSGKNFTMLVHMDDFDDLIGADAELVIERLEDFGWKRCEVFPLADCNTRPAHGRTTSCKTWVQCKDSHFRVNVPLPADQRQLQRVSIEVRDVKQWTSVAVERENNRRHVPGPDSARCPACNKPVSRTGSGVSKHLGRSEKCREVLAAREACGERREETSETPPKESFGPALTTLFSSIQARTTESHPKVVRSGKARRRAVRKEQRRRPLRMPYVLPH